MSQWTSSWIVGRRKIRISKVSTGISNGNFSPFFLSVDGMLGKEALFVLETLSRIMAENSRNPFHTYVDVSTDGLQSRSHGRTPA